MIVDDDDAASEIQPYPGLRPFRDDETHLYFGREQHRGELLKRLVVTRFVAVIGTSGSGKSSLVRAGLLPDLLGGYLRGAGSDWVIVETTPGADPVGRLAAAFVATGWDTEAPSLRTNSSAILDLAARNLTTGQHLLILADQFEELFRLRTSEDPAADADEKAAFVRLLLNAAGQRADATTQNAFVHVVMAMRSEFLGRASAYRGLPEAIDQGQYLIPRLSRDQLRKAIESPARVANGEIDEALVQRVLNELGDDQDQLPVLQHALLRCWQLRDAADRIGADAYTRSGGLAGALSLDANEALDEVKGALGERGAQIVSRVFQGLRETDINGGQTRRPTTAGELMELAGCTLEEVTLATAPFRRRSFVLPSPDVPLVASTILDISHEALLRCWDTLRKWIDEDELDRARYLRLAIRAADEAGSENPQYFMPPQLDLLVRFWADRNPSRAWARRHHKGYEQAKAFLHASEHHRRTLDEEDARRQVEATRQQQALEDAVMKRRRTRQRAWIGSVLAATVLIGAGLAVSSAREQTRRLTGWTLLSKAASLPETGVAARLQLAAEAARYNDAPEMWRELLRALFVAVVPRTPVWASTFGPGSVAAVSISPNGEWLYVVADGRLRGIELGVDQERYDVPMTAFPGPDSAFDSTYLWAVNEKLLMIRNRVVYLIDGRTGQLLASPSFKARSWTSSTNAPLAAFLGPGGDPLILCDLATNCASPTTVGVREHLGGESADDLALSSDGTTLALIGRHSLALIHLNPWQVKKLLTREEALLSGLGDLHAIGVDSGARHVVVCTSSHLLQYDAYDSTLDQRSLRKFQSTAPASACIASDERIVSAHDDGTVRVWTPEGTPVTSVGARVSDWKKMALGAQKLVAAGEDQFEVWDTSLFGRRSLASPQGFARRNLFAYSDGQLLAMDSGAVTTGPQLTDDGGRLVAVSDSMRLAAYVRADRQLRVATLSQNAAPLKRWDAPIATSDANERGSSFAVTFSLDDRYVAVATANSTEVTAVDTEKVISLKGWSLLSFAPNDSVVAVDGKGVGVVSLADGRERGRLKIQPLRISFSARGNLFAAVVADAMDGGDTAAGKARASDTRNTTVELYRWPDLELVARLPHSETVAGVSFSANGTRVLTWTTAPTAHVWNVDTQREVANIPLRSDASRLTGVAFTANDDIAILDDVGVTVLPSDPNEWLNEACRRLVRNLTEEEWDVIVGRNLITYRRTCSTLP